MEDLDGMQAFYENVVRLELLRRTEDHGFFRIAEGYGGQMQVFALFDRTAIRHYQSLSPPHTTLDHFAFEIDLDNFDSERARIEAMGYHVRVRDHAWTQWHGQYIKDLEGNTGELVCFDPSIA